jgi:hypothetical protein
MVFAQVQLLASISFYPQLRSKLPTVDEADVSDDESWLRTFYLKSTWTCASIKLFYTVNYTFEPMLGLTGAFRIYWLLVAETTSLVCHDRCHSAGEHSECLQHGVSYHYQETEPPPDYRRRRLRNLQ